MRTRPIVVAACKAAAIAAAFFLPASPALPAYQSAQPTTTRSSWRQALDATHQTTNRKKESGAAVTTFDACFSKGTNGKCQLLVNGSRDPFKRLTTFTFPLSTFFELGYLESSVSPYISVVDCMQPALILNPRSISKRYWIDSKKIIFLSNDDIILDQIIDKSLIERLVEGGTFIESGHVPYQRSDINKLSKLINRGSLNIRISGDKYHSDLSKKMVDIFSSDLARALAVYEIITTKLDELPSKTCID